MINRDKQIALMRVASERVESPLQVWTATDEVRALLFRSPVELATEARKAHSGTGKTAANEDAYSTMLLACA